MKTRIVNALRWCMVRLPEVLLVFFLASLLPLVFLTVRAAVRQVGMFLGGPLQYGGWLWTNIWQTLASVLCVLGVAAVAALVWFNRDTVWAVARKLILEALHRRVVLVLLVFFAVLMPVLPFVLTTEGTQKSQVQIVLQYSLVLALVLLSLLAIFMTTASICSEVERKQVHITDTKPMRRWQFLFGKWFGALVLCTAVMGVMTAGTYVLVTYVAREPNYKAMPAEDASKAEADHQALQDEVFVSRKSVVTQLPDVSEEAHELAMKDLAKQSYGWAFHSAEQSYQRQLLFRTQTVPGGSGMGWFFGGLKPSKEGKVYVQFKAYVYDALEVHGVWVAYHMVAQKAADGKEPKLVPVPVGVPVTNSAGWTNATVQKIDFPASYIAPDGTLGVHFDNINPKSLVVFDIDKPVEVLQREEGFVLNYYRSVVVIMAHVALLAAFGVMAGALFSFPVASLVVVCLFVGGVIGPWFTKQFVQPDIYLHLTSKTVYFDVIWRTVAGGIMAVMPDFGDYSPLGNLLDGRTVTMGNVTMAGAVLFCIKGGLALLVGMYFYSRRELAKTIV
jgi:ABC-type transport system involved in multi-copper enzyme maturation permease subunit